MRRLLTTAAAFTLALTFAATITISAARVGAAPQLEPSDKAVLVDCETTKGRITLAIEPTWAPRGAARFLELVDAGFFSSLPLFRCVADFLCQFGYNSRGIDERQYPTIPDDPPQAKLRRFHRGYISAAGNGKDSRSVHFFITFGEHVESLGREPWETPVGFVLPSSMSDVVSKWETSYGDMPPWGGGPDPGRIQSEGPRYLKMFPKLDYFTSCKRKQVEREEV